MKNCVRLVSLVLVLCFMTGCSPAILYHWCEHGFAPWTAPVALICDDDDEDSDDESSDE